MPVQRRPSREPSAYRSASFSSSRSRSSGSSADRLERTRILRSRSKVPSTSQCALPAWFVSFSSFLPSSLAEIGPDKVYVSSRHQVREQSVKTGFVETELSVSSIDASRLFLSLPLL